MRQLEKFIIHKPGMSVVHAGEENQTTGVACPVHSTATGVMS